MIDLAACPATLFTRPDQVAKIPLPENARFVMFVLGDAPQVIPIDDPGTYEIDVRAIADGKWPVLIVTVPEQHAPQFAAMTAEKSLEILLRVAIKVRKRERTR